MSDWIGPNTYYIVSRMKDTVFLDLAGGSPANDTKVQIWYVISHSIFTCFAHE